jgi:hypothetical protein
VTDISGKRAFFNKTTGAEFLPKGYNYSVIESRGTDPNCQRRHVTFDTNKYDPNAAESFLAQMQYDGYNTVRVMVDVGDICRQAVGQYSATPASPIGAEVNPGYVANVANFLARAKSHGVYVILTMNYVPQSPYYFGVIGNSPEPSSQIYGEHRYLLTQGGHQAKSTYIANFITALKNASIPVGELLPTVLAYELQNEVAVFDNVAPFSLSSGLVKFGNGVTYDMSSTASRQQAVDANVVQWAIVGRNGAKSADPEALVSASVFTFSAVKLPGANGIRAETWRGNEHRHPARVASLHQWSTLDFTDIHLYPKQTVTTAGGGTAPYTQASDLATSEFSSMNLTTTGKPVITGEFGALKAVYGCASGDVITAANAMGSFRSEAKSAGFKGALFWAWNSTLPNQPPMCSQREDWWNAVDYSGAINGVLHAPF